MLVYNLSLNQEHLLVSNIEGFVKSVQALAGSNSEQLITTNDLNSVSMTFPNGSIMTADWAIRQCSPEKHVSITWASDGESYTLRGYDILNVLGAQREVMVSAINLLTGGFPLKWNNGAWVTPQYTEFSAQQQIPCSLHRAVDLMSRGHLWFVPHRLLDGSVSTWNYEPLVEILSDSGEYFDVTMICQLIDILKESSLDHDEFVEAWPKFLLNLQEDWDTALTGYKAHGLQWWLTGDYYPRP